MELDIEQKSEAWFTVRRCYITGTMFASIMGVNPYHSLADVLEEMDRERMGMDRKQMSPQSLKNVEWGINHEADGISEYETKVLGAFPMVSKEDTLPSLNPERELDKTMNSILVDSALVSNSSKPKEPKEVDVRLDVQRRVRKVGFIIDKDTYKFGVSPDGLIGDDGIIEVKCPVSRRFYSTIPEYYIYQVMALLGVTKRKWCDLVQV